MQEEQPQDLLGEACKDAVVAVHEQESTAGPAGERGCRACEVYLQGCSVAPSPQGPRDSPQHRHLEGGGRQSKDGLKMDLGSLHCTLVC